MNVIFSVALFLVTGQYVLILIRAYARNQVVKIGPFSFDKFTICVMVPLLFLAVIYRVGWLWVN